MTDIEELREEIMQRFVTAWQDGFGCATNKNYESRHDLHTDFVIQLIQQKAIEARLAEAELTKSQGQKDSTPYYIPYVFVLNRVYELQTKLNNNKKGNSDEKNQI